MKDIFTRVEQLHKKVRFFFVGSLDNEGFPNIKAILPAKYRESLKEIYFSTNTSSYHVEQFRKNPNSCVYFFSPFFYKGVLLKGKMEIVEDIETKKHFWRRGDKRYYSQGVNDPDYCILKFTPDTGRYYYRYKSNDFIIN